MDDLLVEKDWVGEQTLRISGVMVLGPFDEKEAINGAGFIPSWVLTRVR